MNDFNLIDEPWIPVQLTNGQRDVINLRDLFVHAPRIQALEHQSPLVITALHRFLVAILYRALSGPTDFEEAQALFHGQWPSRTITAYLQQWYDRFWLFHPQYPFSQIPMFCPDTLRPWTVLAAERNADRGKVLFDHTVLSHSGTISKAEATLQILATQTFTLGGGNSALSYTRNAPSATAAMMIPIGRSLQETLLYCLVPQDTSTLKHDLPLWERQPESLHTLSEGFERPPNGFADLYTWRSRTLRLEQDSQDAIPELAFGSGVGYTPTLQDPFLAYRLSTKEQILPVQLAEHGIWRTFSSLLPEESGLGSQILAHAMKLHSDHSQCPLTILVTGLTNTKAKIEFWRMESFRLPSTVLSPPALRTQINQLLQDAQEAQRGLWKACLVFTKQALAHKKSVIDHQSTLTTHIKKFPCFSLYWGTLESAFHALLHNTHFTEDGTHTRQRWLNILKATVTQVWEEQRRAFPHSTAQQVGALIKAEDAIANTLKRLTQLHHDLQKTQEAA